MLGHMLVDSVQYLIDVFVFLWRFVFQPFGPRKDSSIFEMMMVKYDLTTIAKSNVLAGSLLVSLQILYAFLSLRK